MCAPFSVHDDNLLDAEATAALEAAFAAEKRRLAMAIQIANGAVRYAFPHHNADDAIAATVAKVTETRFVMDRLIASRAVGEKFKAFPSPGAQCLALQDRVTANEAKANIHPLGPVLTATSRVDAAERSLILAAHGAGVRIPNPDDLQGGFHSSVVG